MKSINVEKKHSINTSDFRKFHVETSTFITNSGAMPAHQHKRTTPKTVLLTHITDHLQKDVQKKGVPHPPPRCPSCSTRARLRLFGQGGLEGWMPLCGVRGWVLMVFLGGGGL